MDENVNVTLAELVVETKDGDWGKDSPAEGLIPYRVIRGTDFPSARVGNISSVPLRYIPQRTAFRRTLEADDILIETAGGSRDRPTGRTLLVTQHLLDSIGDPTTCASFARFLRIDKTRANPRFIFWHLQHLHQIGEMWKHQVQHTGVARFQYTRFAATHRIPLPSMSKQGAIASVLGALDEKIIVNDRIATTALAFSDSVFQSLVADIEPGPDTFASVANVFGGGTPRTSEASYWDGDIAWTTPTDVTGLRAPYLFHTKRTITESGLANCASRLYPAGSIFMTSRATIGAFAMPQIPAAVNQGFIVVVPPKRELRWWLFHEMRSRVEEMISLANGSTFLELSRKNFKAMPVRLGSDDLIARFHDQVDALHLRAARAAQETKMLAELRDTLLPKLMSGEIRVRDAEKAVEDAA